MSDRLRRQYPLILFILFYLIWANFTFKDFGETFDESGVYTRGIALQHYLLHDDFYFFLHKSSVDDGIILYDHFYSLILFFFNPTGDVADYHWLNMFFALSVFIALFEILLWQTQKPWWALAGPVFLALTPRFLGNIPGNPKDMPFAAFYFLSLCAIYLFHQKPQIHPYFKVLALGLLFGCAQTSRLLGLSLFPVYILFDLHFFYHGSKHTLSQWKDHLLEMAAVLASIFMISSFLLVLTWPYLGANYLHHFIQLLGIEKNFPWNNNVLFMGKEIPSTHLPLTYIPVWILITTPLFILFFLGSSWIWIKNKLTNPLFVLMGIAAAVNLGLYFILKPVVYDGLRLFLFILPILVAIAALSAAEWVQHAKRNWVFKTLLCLCLFNGLTVIDHLVQLHPYEYIYFNELVGGLKGAQGQFDNDYWGASFKEAVDWIAQNETNHGNKTYLINGSGNPYQIFYYFTPNMKWTDHLKNADYYISYTRDHKQDLENPSKIIHVVEREGVPLNYIFKLK